MVRKVLVLNQDFRVLTTCSVERGFSLIYSDKADMVSYAKNVFLRTIKKMFPVPSIIRLKQYVNKPYQGVLLNRQNVFKRDKNECLYCGSKLNLTLDHVLPRSRGGKSTWVNLATCCHKCNSRKGNLLPEEAKMILKYKPYKPSNVAFIKNSIEIDEEWKAYLS